MVGRDGLLETATQRLVDKELGWTRSIGLSMDMLFL